MHQLTNLLLFGTPLLYYYINLNSSIIFCLSCGEIYLCFGISLLATFECGSLAGFFEILVILFAIELPTRSPVASAVFGIALLPVIFNASVADFLAVSTSFDHVYYLNF